MTRMFRLPKNGGNPFLFSYSAPKPHELRNKVGDQPITTAATDGRKYYWAPEFISKLSADELAWVMQHESYHDVFFHSERMIGCHPWVRNVAMDYVVDACIEVDHEKSGSNTKLWGGNLGNPLPLRKLLDWIDANKGVELPKDEPVVFTDKSLFGRSPESIYDEIMKHWEKSPRKCPTCGALSLNPKTKKPTPPGPCKDRGPRDDQGGGCSHDGQCCPDCGAPPSGNGGSGKGEGLPQPMDAHIDSKASKAEVQTNVMRAARQASQTRGFVPSAIEEYLNELMNPTLKFTDIVRSSCMKKVQDAGLKNDWKRFRRRYISASPRQYLPKRHTHRPRWLCMLDTSGSMGPEDLVYGVSQLQVLGNGTEGYVVPVDAEVHWNAVTSIKNLEDLKQTKIVGRGGTVFDDFFKEFPNHLGLEFDCVIIITDGECGQIPIELKPPIDVVWVLTRGYHKDWKNSFGRVAPLRHEKM
jgi:predicted metal-dependent peptidase